jgi:hypothetical protein
MIDFLSSLPGWLGGLLTIALSTAFGFATYAVSHKLLARNTTEETGYAIRSLFGVVGVLVSLMLSLAFAEVLTQNRAIRNALEREAVAISDVFDELHRYDSERTRRIRRMLANYTQAVIDDDWPALADGRLGERASALNRQFTDSVIRLGPTGMPQQQAWARIISDLDAASDQRLMRLDSALTAPPIFVYVVVFGFLVTMACFGVYPPQKALLTLMSLYTVFVGMVLYLILSLSDPFQGGMSVEPTMFEHLVERMQADLQ